MELKNVKFGNIKVLLKGIIKTCSKNTDEKKLSEYINERPYLLDSCITRNTRYCPNLQSLINTLFKNEPIKEYYTKKRITQIIVYRLTKKILHKASFNFNDRDYDSIVRYIQDDIINLKEQLYAFQVLRLKYSGEDVEFGSCTLRNFKGEKVHKHPLSEMVPKPYPGYPYYIVVKVKGNDPTIDYKKALQLAKNFVNILKMKFKQSPFLKLHDTYFCPFRGAWWMAYGLSEVRHEDLELKDSEQIKEVISGFESILEDSQKSALYESLSLSLNRLSYALTIHNPSFRLAEIMGCIETLLTKRSEAKKEDSNIPELLTKRIFSLLGNFTDKEYFKAIMDEYYEDRSEYAHQSNIDEVEHKANRLVYFYKTIIEKYIPLLDKYKSKKELLAELDKTS